MNKKVTVNGDTHSIWVEAKPEDVQGLIDDRTLQEQDCEEDWDEDEEDSEDLN